MTLKYKNGMWKTTSKTQDDTAQKFFKLFSLDGSLKYMSMQFNYNTGSCEYIYYFYNGSILNLCIARNNKIVVNQSIIKES